MVCARHKADCYGRRSQSAAHNLQPQCILNALQWTRPTRWLALSSAGSMERSPCRAVELPIGPNRIGNVEIYILAKLIISSARRSAAQRDKNMCFLPN